jgi:hypothetical protein
VMDPEHLFVSRDMQSARRTMTVVQLRWVWEQGSSTLRLSIDFILIPSNLATRVGHPEGPGEACPPVLLFSKLYGRYIKSQ